MRALLLIIALAGCEMHIAETKMIGGERVEFIYSNPGGFLGPGIRAWNARRANVDRYVIDGHCDSLCVHLVMAERFCYTDRATLWMHPALIGGLVETPETRRWTEWSISRWPVALREWWRENKPGALGITLTVDDLRRIAPQLECGA